MAKAHCCDKCGKLIKDSDIRITIDGFSVLQNRDNKKMPKGFSIGKPEDFCSFDCLSEWAQEQQKLLDEYMEISEKHYGEAMKDGSTTD